VATLGQLKARSFICRPVAARGAQACGEWFNSYVSSQLTAVRTHVIWFRCSCSRQSLKPSCVVFAVSD